MDQLKGKSIIVTGGGSGIGAAVALCLMQEGALVTVADRDGAAAAAVAAEADSLPGTARSVTVDVSREPEVVAMVSNAMSVYGKVDGACTAAGLGPLGKMLHEMTVEEWDRHQAVNLRGVFICIKHQILAMLPTGGGSIVNIASTAAIRGFPQIVGLLRCQSWCYWFDKGSSD